MILYLLILTHLLYDFHWQGPYIAAEKGKDGFLLLVHALTWTLLLGSVLWFCGAFMWWKIGFLLATHFVIDRWKAKSKNAPAYYLYIDQGLHLVTMLIVTLL